MIKKTSISIKGMHCRSCELLIEDELSKIEDVKKVVVCQKNGTAEIYHSKELNLNRIETSINQAGYALGKEEKPLISKNLNDYLDLIIAGLIIAVFFFFASNFGLFSLTNKTSGNFSSLPIVLLIGLTAGISTCMALVGGLVLGASARFAEKHPNATSVQKFKPHIFFNLGRIISYFVLGAVIGFAGSFFQLSPFILGFLTIAVGVVMLFLGFQLIEIFPRLSNSTFTLPKTISRFLGIKDTSAKEYSHTNSMFMGALTFFLPCGFTQAMQLYAISTGNPVSGALTMGVFAIGTAPGLLGIGGLTSVIKGAFAKSFFKFAGVVVILLAFFNLSNGLNLAGFNLSIFADSKVSSPDSNVVVKDGVQVVKMTQSTNGYSPNSFTIKKGLPVKWIITSTDVNTCASTIVSAKFNIRQSLQEGENVIEFTPTEVGQARFSCIMGMYNGVFNVVDQGDNSTTINNTDVSQTAKGCGGGAGAASCGNSGGIKKTTESSAQTTPVQAEQNENSQLIKATYSLNDDIQPNRFTVKANLPVRFEILAKDDGAGCMGSVFIPGLTQKVEIFEKDKTVIFEFTPKSGKYQITCGMGVPRGEIIVN